MAAQPSASRSAFTLAHGSRPVILTCDEHGLMRVRLAFR